MHFQGGKVFVRDTVESLQEALKGVRTKVLLGMVCKWVMTSLNPQSSEDDVLKSLEEDDGLVIDQWRSENLLEEDIDYSEGLSQLFGD